MLASIQRVAWNQARRWASTINPAEQAKFAALAPSWWSADSPAAALHALNPARVKFIALAYASAQANAGLAPNHASARVLDVGCGGGVLAEPLARLGFGSVKGIDISQANVDAARAHASSTMAVGSGIGSLEYEAIAAEDHVAKYPDQLFDVVVASEVIEHVADVPLFVSSLASLVAPSGTLVISTLNRTALSYATAIVGAERVCRILPEGTHDWNAFLTPDELEAHFDAAGLDLGLIAGMVPDPIERAFTLHPDHLSINYIAAATPRPAQL